MTKKVFEKFYNRSMPLLSVEYWHRGEYEGLSQLTDGLVSYNPLFIFKKGKGVDIYYNVREDIGLANYFKKRYQKFNKIADQYEKNCQEMGKLSKTATPKDFSRIFNLHLNFWPKFAIMIALGGLKRRKGKSQMVKRAYNLRKTTDKIEYLSANKLISLINKVRPEFKEFSNFLTFNEITGAKEITKRELIKRKNGYIYYNSQILTGLSLEEFQRKNSLKIVQVDSDIVRSHLISGSIAMPGKVKGKVKVIFNFDQLSKVRKGDILVTPMTTPDYLLVMQKAAAFVTDEGGITCHAAIVAREFGKPCITGTKTATQRLKDGDLVEVNADDGIVRILK